MGRKVLMLLLVFVCDSETCRYSSNLFRIASIVFTEQCVRIERDSVSSKAHQPDRNWIVLYCLVRPFSSIFSVRFFFASCHNHKQSEAKKKTNWYKSLIEEHTQKKRILNIARFSISTKSKNGNTKIAQIRFNVIILQSSSLRVYFFFCCQCFCSPPFFFFSRWALAQHELKLFRASENLQRVWVL